MSKKEGWTRIREDYKELQRHNQKRQETTIYNNKNHQYQSLEILRNTPMLQRFDLLFLFDPAIVASPTCPSEQKQPYIEIRCQLKSLMELCEFHSKDVYRFSTHGRRLNISQSSFIIIDLYYRLRNAHICAHAISKHTEEQRWIKNLMETHYPSSSDWAACGANSIIHERILNNAVQSCHWVLVDTLTGGNGRSSTFQHKTPRKQGHLSKRLSKR